MITPASNRGDSATDRMSIMTMDTAVTARSMRESIMSLYGHQSYYQIILDPREGNFDMAPETLVDHSRISMIIEDHLHANTGQSLNLSDHGKRECFVEDPLSAGEDSRYLRFFDNEVLGTKGTEHLWDIVSKHRDHKRSTPSEGSIASDSTILTRASNLIQIAFIPGVTNRSDDKTPLLIPPIPPPPSIPITLTNKPLPSLPREAFATALPNMVQHEEPQISPMEPDWLKATNGGIVPADHMNLL